jgi:hypothetical protein
MLERVVKPREDFVRASILGYILEKESQLDWHGNSVLVEHRYDTLYFQVSCNLSSLLS